jgi:hypothetical protein
MRFSVAILLLIAVSTTWAAPAGGRDPSPSLSRASTSSSGSEMEFDDYVLAKDLEGKMKKVYLVDGQTYVGKTFGQGNPVVQTKNGIFVIRYSKSTGEFKNYPYNRGYDQHHQDTSRSVRGVASSRVRPDSPMGAKQQPVMPSPVTIKDKNGGVHPYTLQAGETAAGVTLLGDTIIDTPQGRKIVGFSTSTKKHYEETEPEYNHRNAHALATLRGGNQQPHGYPSHTQQYPQNPTPGYVTLMVDGESKQVQLNPGEIYTGKFDEDNNPKVLINGKEFVIKAKAKLMSFGKKTIVREPYVPKWKKVAKFAGGSLVGSVAGSACGAMGCT